MGISGLVITFNEEKYIGKCIEGLQRICDEIIIIDSNSRDKTVEIATALGATVISQPFLGDGPQRTFGLQFCQHDWILNVDTDELDRKSTRLNSSHVKTSYAVFCLKK